MLAIDSNIFLELLLQQDHFEEARLFLEQVRDGKVKAAISDFNVSGIALVMARYGKDAGGIRTFLVSLLGFRGLSIYKATMSDKIHSTHLMEAQRLDFEDALTLQCALSAGCSGLVSFDRDFDGIGKVKRVTPKEALEKFG